MKISITETVAELISDVQKAKQLNISVPTAVTSVLDSLNQATGPDREVVLTVEVK